MKRWFAAATAGILATALLMGCQARGNSSTPEESNSPSSSTDSSLAQQVGSPIDEAAFTKAMDGVADYEADTAGGSLKVYLAAAGMLDFTETYDDATQRTALSDSAVNYLHQLGGEKLPLFLSNWPAVDAAARNYLSGDEEALQLMKDAGSPLQRETYSLEKYDAVATLIGDLADQLAEDE